MTARDLLFTLLRFEIASTPFPKDLVETIDNDTMAEVVTIAQRHSIAHLIADAVEKNNLPVQESLAKFLKKQKQIVVMRYIQMDEMLKRIKNVLNEAKIPYIPLKGVVMQQYYPEAWMRNSCDMDILVYKEDLQKANDLLVTRLQFKKVAQCSHDISYSFGSVHVELHFELLEDDWANNARQVLKNVWEYSKNREGTFEYIMDEEFFYFYHIAHMVKHMKSYGIGLRHFIDLWILNENLSYDVEYEQSLLSKCDLQNFEKEAYILTKNWFELTEETSLTNRIEEYVLNSGTYGNKENYVDIHKSPEKSKFQYFFSRLFLPYKEMSRIYPILKKLKFLLPCFWLWRCILIIASPSKFKDGVQEMRYVQQMHPDKEKWKKELMLELHI